MNHIIQVLVGQMFRVVQPTLILMWCSMASIRLCLTENLRFVAETELEIENFLINGLGRFGWYAAQLVQYIDRGKHVTENMSNYYWKIIAQLKEAVAKVANDKAVHNIFGKDNIGQRPASANVLNINTAHNLQDHSVPTSDKSTDTASYNLPHLIQGLKQKEKLAVKEKELQVQQWKQQIKISKSSIVSRTSHILSSLMVVESETSLINRLESLVEHMKLYPEARIMAYKEGAVKLLLEMRASHNNYAVQCVLRECLALLGYSDPPTGRGIRILSIDGGGIRALLVLEMLKKLEELTGQRVHELFDLCCGVSTGAIITFALGINHSSIDEIAEAYKAISTEVFSQSALWGTGSLVWTHAYYDTALWEKKLKFYLGEQQLISTSRDPLCPKLCAVSAVVNQSRLSAYIFRNYTLPAKIKSQYPGNCEHAVWQAARASAAAPTYFEEFKLGNFLHQDGGILFNNPATIALHEAKLIWPNEPIQCVVSFGTGRTVPNPVETQFDLLDSASTTSWTNKFFKILDSATDTEGVHIILNDLLPDTVYYRFNPYLAEMISMVEIRPEKLAQMQRDVLMYLRRNEDKFQEAAKALTQQKNLIHRTKDWVTLKRHTYGY